MATTDLPTDLYIPLEDPPRPRTPCCTLWCCTRSASAAGVVLAMAVIANIIQRFMTGGDLRLILVILLGAILPAIVVMVWFSEAQGGYSVDKCQIATVSFTCMGLTVAWVLVSTPFAKALAELKGLDPTCCDPTILPNSTSNAFSNGTAAAAPFCFCPGNGLNTAIIGAVPEEVLKYAAFSMFA